MKVQGDKLGRVTSLSSCTTEIPPKDIQSLIKDEWYKAVIQSALEGFCLANLKGEILDVNKSFCHMLGYSREELLNMKIQDIDVGFIESSKNYTQEILEVKRAGGRLGEVRHRCKDGRIIDVLVSVKYLNVGPGFIFCFHNDITERKQMDEKLRESKAFTESLIISMKDGFSLLDNRGVHLNVNDALCRMTGFTREELIGTRPPHLYWAEENYEDIQAAFQKTLKGEFADFDLIFKRKNEERFPVIVSPTWLKDKDGNIISYFATIKDISNLKDMQEQVIKAASQAIAARESEKMKTELLSMVSHELRTPLASIKGFASTLLQPDVRWSEDEKWDFIREIDTEADRLSHLVDDLLDMSSIEAGTLSLNKTRYSISKTLEEAKPMLAKIAKQNELKVEATDKLPLVIIDRERIMQVLSNLVDNAVKFSPIGSQITIEVKKSQGKVVVSVTDQGIGIPVALQSKLFDRFYQAKKITYGVKRGTGLGLAICKGLVEAHGGKIWLDSHEGRGSTFYFSLPICRSD